MAEFKAKLSHFLRLAKSGQKVVIFQRNKPAFQIVPIKEPFDEALFDSAFGMFPSVMTPEQLHEALRPMTDEEADAFIEGRY